MKLVFRHFERAMKSLNREQRAVIHQIYIGILVKLQDY
jgi:hypothetical protein